MTHDFSWGSRSFCFIVVIVVFCEKIFLRKEGTRLGVHGLFELALGRQKSRLLNHCFVGPDAWSLSGRVLKGGTEENAPCLRFICFVRRPYRVLPHLSG